MVTKTRRVCYSYYRNFISFCFLRIRKDVAAVSVARNTTHGTNYKSFIEKKPKYIWNNSILHRGDLRMSQFSIYIYICMLLLYFWCCCCRYILYNTFHRNIHIAFRKLMEYINNDILFCDLFYILIFATFIVCFIYK